MKCHYCEKDFIKPRADAIYCNKKCRDAAYKKRKRERSPKKELGIDLTGQTFGRLTVLERTDERYNTFVVYKCLCECGNKTKANTGTLRSGSKRSCGCLEVENRERINSSFGDRTRKHGWWKKPAYKSWQAMKSRCANKNDKNYGGKGIRVCEEWDKSFERFIKDMGPPPPGGTIDRIDNSGDYTKDNCRWAVPKEQCRNRTNNSYVDFNGELITVAEYAERLGMSWSGADKKAKREGIHVGKMVPGGAFVKETV